MYIDIEITNSISREIVVVICAVLMLVSVATAKYYLRNFFSNAIVTVVVVFYMAIYFGTALIVALSWLRFSHIVCSDKNISFRTPFSWRGVSSIPLIITPTFTGLSNVTDFSSQYYRFEYRPNPVMEEIQTATTILR